MKRRTIFMIAAMMIGTIAICAAAAMPRLFIWNASASVPIGLYAVQPASDYVSGDLLIIAPPQRVEEFLSAGGYMPAGVPLLKHVAALPGQTVCRIRNVITIDMHVVGNARSLDSKGRPLPDWQGCIPLAAHQIFLMNIGVPDSLDGRYFGPFVRADIIGRAVPVWTDEAGNGQYFWHGFEQFMQQNHH